MLTNDMRYRICDEFLEEDEISTKQLMDLGLKKHDIQKLVNEKTLTRIKRGLYKFSDVELLCKYGLQCLADSRLTDDKKKKEEKLMTADKCFKRCHSMNNKSRDVNLHLLLHFIVNKNYEKAYEVLEFMYNTDDEDAIRENNLFLYLLSCHEKCPLGLYERISSICLDDLTLGGLDDEFSKLIISLIYTQEFERVRELITNLVIDDSAVAVKISILKVLLNRAVLNIQFADLRAVLKENRVDDFYKLLFVYLRIIGREEYNYLIIWLTKLCVLDNDLTFDLVFRELVELEKSDYYDVSAVFISSFYQYVAAEKYKQASICLKIIEKYGCLSPEIVDDLRKKVDKGGKHKENTKLDLDSLNQNDYEDVKKELASIIKCMRNDGEIVHIISGVSSEYRGCVYSIFNEKPMDKRFENIKFWSFGNDSQTIVLRLINPEIGKIDIGKHLGDIFGYFDRGQYDDCIKLVEELLQYESFEIRSLQKARNLFYVLGISYIKSSTYISKSRKFLALTTEMNGLLPKELQDGKYDLTLLVDKLTKKKAKSQRNGNRNRVIAKARKVLPTRTEVKWESFFGENISGDDVVCRLARLQDILYTFLELDKSLDDMVREANLTGEDILLIRLIKARDFYVDDLYQEGDNELRKVTLSPDKTPLVETVIQQILSHKFDYRRMKNIYARKLVHLEDCA